MFGILISMLGIIFFTSNKMPKIKENDKKLKEMYKEQVKEFSQKTESDIIENTDKNYSKQTVFMAEKVRITTWIHPETKVEYIIIESYNSGGRGANASSISITPSLNPDGTIRVRNDNEVD